MLSSHTTGQDTSADGACIVSTPPHLRARVLVIDDDAAVANLLQLLLDDEGFETAVCGLWQEALGVVACYRPDLVLLDLRLGDGEHGWRILDHLTLDPATRGIPVILCPGAHRSLQAHAPALLPRHGVFVVPKPFELGLLLATIDEALAARPSVMKSTQSSPANIFATAWRA
jgi:two-component system response regulator MtrA